jgi:hypothetical protein
MDRERAETFLRLLAETELRRATARPRDRAVVAGCITRVMRVVRVLTIVGALGDELAGQVLDDFELGLGTRGVRSPGQYGRALRSQAWSLPPGQPPHAPDRSVPVGQVIPLHGEQVSGEVTLLSYAQTEAGALLTLVARPAQLSPAGPGRPRQTMPGPPAGRRQGAVMIPYRQFTAADDRGTGYQMSYHGNNSRPGEWTLRLHPDPPRDLSWLDLTTTPGKPPVRIDLTPPRPAAATVRPVTGSPAGQLLTNLATRLLTTGAIFPQDILILLTELEGVLERPWPPGTVDGLGDVIAALQASGALPPASPVPGQLAALCACLNVTGHGITMPPARDLPEPWLSVLTHHRAATRTAPERDGCAAVAAALPDLDGIRLSILGLTSSADGTILHTYASGPMRSAYYGSPERNLAPAIWIHDSRGDWHATRVTRYHEGDITMRLQMLPPLSHNIAWIEVIVTGHSAEARATLPLRWQQRPLPGQRPKRGDLWRDVRTDADIHGTTPEPCAALRARRPVDSRGWRREVGSQTEIRILPEAAVRTSRTALGSYPTSLLPPCTRL